MAHRGRKAARKTPYRPRQSEELDPEATHAFPNSVTLPARAVPPKAADSDKILGIAYDNADRSLAIGSFDNVRSNGRNASSLLRTESVPVMGLESLSLGHTESNECTKDPNGTTAAPYGHGAESLHRDGTTHAAAPARTSDWDYSDDISFVATHGRSNGLPFMKRNLRKGFEARFTQSNGRSGTIPPLPLFFHTNEDRGNRGDTIAWKFMQELRRLDCPFCALFDPFGTITHLLRHIEWDHQNYRVSCLRSLGDASTYTLEVTNRNVPEPYSSPKPVQEESQNETEKTTTESQNPAIVLPDAHITAARSTDSAAPPKKSPLGAQSAYPLEVQNSPTVIPPRPPNVQAKSASPEKRFRTRLNGPSKSFASPSRIAPSTMSSQGLPTVEVIVISSGSESDTSETSPQMPTYPNPIKVEPAVADKYEGGVLQNRPSSDETQNSPVMAEGESGGPPRIPEDTKSSRPCGPFLYDLLPAPSAETNESTTVPKEDEWLAVQQDEEIFEIANFLDEDKTIGALWSRWMLVHRNVFLANRYEGVLDFVKSNGRIIQRAAGRNALRAFLLVLHSHRYLETSEVAQLLRVYDRLLVSVSTSGA